MANEAKVKCKKCGGEAEQVSSIRDVLSEGGIRAFKCTRCGEIEWRRYRDGPPMSVK